MEAILEVETPGAGEPEKRLVHERTGVEQRVAAARTQPGARHSAQIAISGGKQRVVGSGIAGLRTVD